MEHIQSEYPEVILASGSAARAAILASAGIRFRQQSSMIDEEAEHRQIASGTPPSDVARYLARLKADDVLAREPGAIVIGGDQVLAIGNEILQKPASQEEAREQLRKLRGRTHELHTAAVVVSKSHAASFVDIATLKVRDFSEKFLDCYLEMSGEGVLNSVGAYHIEGLGIHLFSEIRGDYFTILGLPILPVLEELRSRSIVCR
ncbi:MAG: Maf family protein [Rhodomicrobium sp.]